MSAGNRKYPYEPMTAAAPRRRHPFVALMVIMFLVVTLVSFGANKALAYGPGPIREANCWAHFKVAGMGEFLSEENIAEHGMIDEIWCRPYHRDFTLQVEVANSREEVGHLLWWFRTAPYNNPRILCQPTRFRAYLITDLEDYRPMKKSTPKQQAAYSAWVLKHAERNNCWVR